MKTDKILYLEIDPLVEEEVKLEIGEIIIIETITDPITETDKEADGTFIGQVIGVTITRLTIDEVIREVEIEIEIMIGPFSQDKAHYLVGETNLGPDPTPG